ncbi:protein phosphatase 1 regulatory subunit 3B-B-like isoform X2 [Amphibalanus amphitrite]|uniref:protein phosphatase 1 regulatory subunit 3B-B-like isoform X2 n=1 Tax=Amphibalanus amphitrite TaxID=1232801 RepID=UPI001C91437D|nr:protein phosphatase 1 regulatory subunit 3B-B-like isoform X2 [Amphibalanus amphitrite]
MLSMSLGALVLPVDMEFYSLSSSPVLSSSPRLGADFLSSSPLLGPDFLSELQRGAGRSPWSEPRPRLLNRINCQRRSPAPPSDDEEEDEEDDEEENEEDSADRPRSILIIRSDSTEESRREDKKRVVFADDRGQPLVQIRRMREPSHMPPRWTSRFLRHVTGVEAASSAPQEPRFRLDFPQPAADYSRFCERLDANSVALEHAVYKEAEDRLTGTIKVKNLHFEKVVFVRVSENNWRTSRDVAATYVAAASGGAAGATLYDRFKFELPLTSTTSRLDFCVCFRCPLGEFWDNNNGANYGVSRQKSAQAQQHGPRDIYPPRWTTGPASPAGGTSSEAGPTGDALAAAAAPLAGAVRTKEAARRRRLWHGVSGRREAGATGTSTLLSAVKRASRANWTTRNNPVPLRLPAIHRSRRAASKS